MRPTPFHAAVRSGHVSEVDFLFEHSAVVNVADDDRRTLLGWAKTSSRAIVEVLVTHGGK